MTDKKKIIWAACDDMLREGKERREITGRKVASRAEVEWSHTTVMPYVTSWHDEQTKEEQKMLAQTSMSIHFVKALKSEVEERVTALRQIDAQQNEVMAVQLSDMVTENQALETQLSTLKAELEQKTTQLGSATSKLEQVQSSLEELSLELKDRTAKWEEMTEKTANSHASALSALNSKHSEAVDKLNTRVDDKSKEISDLAARLALAELKAGQHEKLSEDLMNANESVLKLTNENMRLSAEMSATKDTVQNLTESLSDTKKQRDKAQEATENAMAKLDETQSKWNDSLLKAASSEKAEIIN
ncbi:hypothetical protein BCV02_01205 [Vibrio breoganii]|uniref:KfrA N-terminal DNA-binding domain-containing protein n=1 Tax=Vibrio breoganii TaxID=553239 RepID=A0ABX1U6C4_9VIBR|nr:hypothetical protein [Vibrio breoganii]NMO72909.1 hypothetical protein [Vibrio breoganii]NMR68746.1 hypothetical protein [Vibrio breoganii]PMG03927.1 hypothetical protein BCV02_01205 [Vibrio breoganii]PML90995.1 hypothetical protein BCT67_03640 [Vibrio breoganii]